jgi:CHAD domain-containing protein
LRNRPIAALAAEDLAARRRKLVKQGRKLRAMDPDARHRLRIKAKRLRYACGFFESLYSGKAAKAHKALAAAARDMQDRLGALTDIAFSHDLVARVAGLTERHAGVPAGDPKLAFAAGALVGQAASPTRRLLKAAVKAHRTLSETPPAPKS